MTSRRQFIRLVPFAGGAMLAAQHALAADPPMLSEKDPQAAALGYVADASKVDKAKFKNFAAGQHCATCQLYQGKAGTEAGPCTLFQGKQVAAKGWCSAWAKKTG